MFHSRYILKDSSNLNLRAKPVFGS